MQVAFSPRGVNGEYRKRVRSPHGAAAVIGEPRQPMSLAERPGRLPKVMTHQSEDLPAS